MRRLARSAASAFCIRRKRLARCASRSRSLDLRRRARARRSRRRVAAFGSEVDDPVGGAMTSRLCSMTSSEWPAASSLRKARSSFATSSKCRPVVGSSNRNSLPRCVVLDRTGRPLRPGVPRASGAAPRRRTASAPAGRASRTRDRRPPAARSRAATSRESAKERERLGHRHVRAHRRCSRASVRAFALDVEHLVAIAAAVAVRAAQIHVREELHLDVLEAVAAAGRAAPVAGVEAERARGVLALLRRRLAGEQLADAVERADVARGIRARGAADRRSGRPSRRRRSAPRRAARVNSPGASVGLPRSSAARGRARPPPASICRSPIRR